MALPLALQDDDLPILLLDSSDDEDTLATRHESGPVAEEPEQTMDKPAEDEASNAPHHPIPAMQLAFAESLIEATANGPTQKPKLRFADAKERRTRLLAVRNDAPLYTDLWRHRPGQTWHELWKLMAQISFGVYLLLNGIANSNAQVVSILQGHIDEVDEFLETTLEDTNLAIDDIKERMDHLKLPLQNMATFEQMLEDRKFRLQIVTGNEKIEHIVSRTALALRATLTDVEEGLKAIKEFANYLGSQKDGAWRHRKQDPTDVKVADVFDAMMGNTEGWHNAISELQESARELENLLTQLGQVVNEMDRRAGEASRRTKFDLPPFSEIAASEARRPSEPSVRSKRRSPSSGAPSDTRSRSQSDGHAMSHSQRAGSSSLQSSDSFRVSNTSQESHPKVSHERDSVQRADSLLELGSEADEEDEGDEGSTNPKNDQGNDEGLYILQPRTYTPQPPEPVPSPMVHDRPEQPKVAEAPKRTSLRQRLSLKGSNVPNAIQLPPRNPNRPAVRAQREERGPEVRANPNDGLRPPVMSIIIEAPLGDLQPPLLPPPIPSPLSDTGQHYFPVHASPHSPLQRPWTAGTTRPPPRPHTSATNQPSRLRAGQYAPSTMGMSMMSHATTMDPSGKKVKKKKSAFGWLKKAFSLSDEERAAFEAKKQQQQPNRYYEARSPMFLDGRRLESRGRGY